MWSTSSLFVRADERRAPRDSGYGPDPLPAGRAQDPRRFARTRRRSSLIEAAIETPTYDLTVFKLHFGRLTGKAYAKGERVLRFEAIAHNTAELRCGRMIEKFPEIVTQLAGIAERFATALDCLDTGFIGDGILDQLPAGSTLGATRIGGVDLNKKRMHDALSAVLALAPAPHGFKAHPTPSTASAKRPTTCANFAANNSSTSPHARAATGFRRWPRAPSLHCSPCATRSSPRSSRRCAPPPNGTQTSALDTCRS